MHAQATEKKLSPGDIVTLPLGINGVPADIVILGVHYYESGSARLRFRYASNRHRGIDWTGFFTPERLNSGQRIGRDETVSLSPRSLLP